MGDFLEKQDICMFFSTEELSMDSLENASDEDIYGEETPFSDDGEKNESADDLVDPDEIFKDDEGQEIVGEEDESKEDPVNKDDEGSSPKSISKFYSSALQALKDDGILPDLDDDFIKDASSADKFAEAIEMQVNARLGEAERRIKRAIDSNVDEDSIKKFESAINYLESITDEVLSDESDESVELRKRIIYQDYINKGFKPERAQKEVIKSFNAETDIEDARLALESNKEYFSEEYNNVIEEQQKAVRLEKERKQNQINEFKKKAIDTTEQFGIKIDAQTRQKIYENVVKPIHKDDSGNLLTTLQKYSKDNPVDAEYYFGLFYTMTDGFKNIDKFIGQKVSQKSKKAISDLEHKLKNTPIGSDGSVDFDFGKNDDQSVFKDFKLNF